MASSDAGTGPSVSGPRTSTSAFLNFGGVLDRLKTRALPEVSPPPLHQPVNWPPPAPVVVAPEPTTPPPRLDERSRAMFIELSQTSTITPGFSNANLALELLECEEVFPPQSRRAAANRAIVQRIALVGRMVDSVVDDENLPAGFKKNYERLRFTMIKSALADSGFFANRKHPLRADATRLAFRAATAGLDDQAAGRRLDRVLSDTVRDFDLAAAFVHPILIRLQPLPIEVIRDFVQQLRTERGEREAARRAHDLVMKEIELRVPQRASLHARLQYIVHEEWAAVLTWRLIKWGESSAAWRTGLAWLDELLRQTKSIEAGAAPPSALLCRLEAGLREAGRPIAPAVQALLDFRKSAPPAPSESASETAKEVVRPAAGPPALGRLMAGDRWFRIFDHGQQKMRWLKTRGHDSARKLVSFAEMDGTNVLDMSAEQFVEDLRRGLCAANNPDVETTLLVAELRSQMPTAAVATGEGL